MRRVCVVGAGAAGAAAAEEAENAGVRVTLMERSEVLPDTAADWPDLLSASPNPPRRRKIESLGIDFRLGETALSVDESCRVFSQKSRSEFDAVVLATGSRSSPPSGSGMRKPGVYVLDSRESCRSISSRLESCREVAVSGEGLIAMKVAERLRQRGRRVTLFIDSKSEAKGKETAMQGALGSAAKSAGVELVYAKPDRAVGVGKIEGVIVSGTVYPCDLLIVIPSQIPNVPGAAIGRGPKGGVLVDSFLGSTFAGVYAAGACAELAPHNLGQSSTVASAMAAGRVAGANAAGLRVRFENYFDAQVFGVRMISTGLCYEEALLKGNLAGSVTMSFGPAAHCSVVYRKPDGKVLGVELVGDPGASGFGLSMAISKGITLTELAYAHLMNSTDISFVAETAREGLRSS